MGRSPEASDHGAGAIVSWPIPPGAIGLGLRPTLYRDLLAGPQAVDYVEAIADNYLGPAAAPRAMLQRIRERFIVVLHCVGCNLLGHEDLDLGYLDRVAQLADELDAPFVSDHLCWVREHGRHHHDLLPTPYAEELVEFAAERAALIQQHLGRPFGLENLSSYVSFQSSTMGECDFYQAVVERSGCSYMLDLNNIYVSSQNHGFDPRSYLEAIDFSRVLQLHLAGHERLADGSIVDTHDRALCPEVLSMYEQVAGSHPELPALLEWDARIPPMADLLLEIGRIRAARTRGAANGET